jgi:hypothetical protein
MEIKINLDYDQILNLIHQLPDKEIEKLADTLQAEVSSKKSPGSIEDLIDQAPTWTDSELNEFQAARDHINKSRIA